MTRDEKDADGMLAIAKRYTKAAFTLIDPSPRDPLAVTLLRVLDSIDQARKVLKERERI